MKQNISPRTLENRPIWSHWVPQKGMICFQRTFMLRLKGQYYLKRPVSNVIKTLPEIVSDVTRVVMTRNLQVYNSSTLVCLQY